ncbi:UNVERIFIED_CONTAM: hypothetical protein B566_EDAN019140 [Ephemera danica]|nr:hypothetical protein B566_EDAN019140 [Ephemera danica]
MQDTFTRYPIAVAIPDATADTIAREFVRCLVCVFGVPETVLTDNAKNFTSELIRKVCELLHVQQIFTSFYRPQGNSHLERSHKTFADVMKSYVQADHRDWDQWLSFALLAYRNTKHSSTQYSPNFLMFGHEISMPWDDILQPRRPCYAEEVDYVTELQQRLAFAHEHAIEFNRKAAALSRDHYNTKARNPDISEGDIVLMRHRPGPHLSRKLSPIWSSPHRVIRMRSAVTADLENLDTGKTIQCHLSNLVKIQSGVCDLLKQSLDVPPAVTDNHANQNLGEVPDPPQRAPLPPVAEHPQEAVVDPPPRVATPPPPPSRPSQTRYNLRPLPGRRC